MEWFLLDDFTSSDKIWRILLGFQAGFINDVLSITRSTASRSVTGAPNSIGTPVQFFAEYY